MRSFAEILNYVNVYKDQPKLPAKIHKQTENDLTLIATESSDAVMQNKAKRALGILTAIESGLKIADGKVRHDGVDPSRPESIYDEAQDLGKQAVAVVNLVVCLEEFVRYP